MKWNLFYLIVFLPFGCDDKKCAAITALHESYCQNGEAARCYYLQKPIDGF